jgi:hypothetical protein
MLRNLGDRGRMNALLVSEAIKPVEQNADIFTNDSACLAVNEDIRVEKDPHVDYLVRPTRLEGKRGDQYAVYNCNSARQVQTFPSFQWVIETATN